MKIDSLYLKEQFGIVLTKDRNEDLISIESSDSYQGFAIKKLTFRCSVEYKDGMDWKAMRISDTIDISSKGEIKISKYAFILELLSPVTRDQPLISANREASKAIDLIRNEDFKIQKHSTNNEASSIIHYPTNALIERQNDLSMFSYEMDSPAFKINDDQEMYEKVDQLEKEIDKSMWEGFANLTNENCSQLTPKANNENSQSNILKNVLRQRDLNLSRSNSFSSFTSIDKVSNKGCIVNPFKFTHSQPAVDSQTLSQISRSGTPDASTQQNNESQVLTRKMPPQLKKLRLTQFTKTKRRRRRSNLPGKENIADEIKDLEPGTKKVKKSNKSRDKRIHKELENQLNTSNFRKGIELGPNIENSRRKFDMEPEEPEVNWRVDEGIDIPAADLTSSSISDESESHSKYSFRIILDDDSQMKEEAPSKLKQLQVTLSDGEDQDRSFDLKSQSSQLTFRQLKQMVVEKREAAAKKSLDKSVVTQSLIPRETCTICLSEITEELGRLESCVHVFCFNCIVDWAKFANECPLCKRRFNEIVKYSAENVKLESVPIMFKNQTYECDWEELIIDNEAEDNCYVCDGEDNPDVMLVCDQCHFKCCHIYCCNPPLESIPEDEWTCIYCAEQNNNRGNDDQQPRRSTRYQLRNRNRRVANQSLLERLFTADESYFEETKTSERGRPTTRQAARNFSNNTTRVTRGRRDHQNNQAVRNVSPISNSRRTTAQNLGNEAGNRSLRTRNAHNSRINLGNESRSHNNTQATKHMNMNFMRVGPVTRSRTPM